MPALSRRALRLKERPRFRSRRLGQGADGRRRGWLCGGPGPSALRAASAPLGCFIRGCPAAVSRVATAGREVR